jgi:hypothetical protein
MDLMAARGAGGIHKKVPIPWCHILYGKGHLTYSFLAAAALLFMFQTPWNQTLILS